MRLSFHGADREVTGSCHLVECAGRRVLIDCGLFQGSRELDADNAAPFGFAAEGIDFMLLTHAHLDHCGRLPLLSQRGFRGEVIATSASRELARLVILDAAHLQEEDARTRARHAARRGATNGRPLYSVTDALNSFDHFGRTASYGAPVALAPGLRATFLDAGHILGSASILLELEEAGQKRSVLFSGDIGNPGHPLLRGPVTPPRADTVVMETTYGDRMHKSLAASVEELYAAILDTFNRGGNVIIPTFALERAQELLYFLRAGVEQSRLPNSAQVYLDSPMAVSATEIFRRHPECYDAKTAEMFRNGNDPFQLPGLHFTRETAELDRDQHYPRGRHHHGGLRHGHRRPHPASSQAQSVAPGVQRCLCRLRRRGYAGAPHHRWRSERQDSRRRYSGTGAHPHRERLFSARRSSGAVGLA